MFERVLVVCTGNICRSPIGEQLLQQALPHKHIASAGVATERSGLNGHDIDNDAAQVARDSGMTLAPHQAQQLTSELVNNHDLILVMEQRHKEIISERYPQARGKLMRYGEWLARPEGGTGKDIADPYKKSLESHQQVFNELKQASASWTQKLN